MNPFKVGDLVVLKCGAHYDYIYPGSVGTVVQTSYNAYFDIRIELLKAYSDGYHTSRWVHSGHFFLEKEIKDAKTRSGIQENRQKFKVGDTVVANEKSKYTIMTPGWKGVVTKVYTTFVPGQGEQDIKVCNLEGYTKCECSAESAYFDLVDDKSKIKKEETKMAKSTTRKFNVGDRVIATDYAPYGITTHGWMGEVLGVEGDEIHVQAVGDMPRVGCSCWVEAKYFYKEEEKPTTSKSKTGQLTSTKEENIFKDVIFSAPATIVLWKDDTKTVVKCGEGEKYDPEKGLALCIAKKALGNNYDYYAPFKKYLGKYHKKESKKASAKKPAPAKKTPAPKTKKPVAKKTTAKRTATRKSTSKK